MSEPTAKDKQSAEGQIRELKRTVDYQTKEFTIEVIVQKYLDGEAEDENEIFVPAYQRAFVWDTRRKSKFIESVILELPIPYIFLAGLSKEISDDEGRAEIVDGSQRVRTLAAFLQDDLVLVGLEKLSKLNGFRFSDLGPSSFRVEPNTDNLMVVVEPCGHVGRLHLSLSTCPQGPHSGERSWPLKWRRCSPARWDCSRRGWLRT